MIFEFPHGAGLIGKCAINLYELMYGLACTLKMTVQLSRFRIPASYAWHVLAFKIQTSQVATNQTCLLASTYQHCEREISMLSKCYWDSIVVLLQNNGIVLPTYHVFLQHTNIIE